MEVLSTYKDKLASIQELVNRMENGSLEIAELSELEELTREIHERSIILRYKAMEQKVKPESKLADMTIVESEVAVEEEEEELAPVEEEKIETEQEEEVSLDFALFDTSSEEEEETFEVETPIHVMEEPVVEEEAEEEIAQPEIVEPAAAVSGFANTVKIPADAMAHYSVVKIASLIGVLGLNERLRFINELFDGSSEDFSEAIKKLETFESMEEASRTIDHLAATHLWNAEEEAVQEFIIVLKRRYA